jgi:AraC-like DNA-binding protein
MDRASSDSSKSARSPRLPFDKKDYEKSWYPNTDSPPFFMEPFTIGSSHSRRAEVFTGVEIDIMQHGEGVFFLPGHEYPLSRGDVCFYDCMIPHGYRCAEGSVLKVFGIHIRLEAAMSIHPQRGDLRLYEPFAALRTDYSPVLRGAPRFEGILSDAYAIYQSKCQDWDILTWAKIVEAMVEIRKAYTRAGEGLGNRYWLFENAMALRALQFIERHFREPVGLPEIARACCCSTSRLSHVFSSVMSVSPIDYRNRLRIVHAMDRIAQTDERLDHVAAEAGFQSFSQFCSLFKRITGRTPAALRK